MQVTLYLLIFLELCDAVRNVTFKQTVQSECTRSCTVYGRSFRKLLNRNKRWFVFPQGANAVLTMVVTKTVLDGIPRGLQESMELEMGYPLPPWVEGWRPTPILDAVKDKSIKSNPKTVGLNKNQSVSFAQPKMDVENDVWNRNQWHRRRIQKKPIWNERQQFIKPSFRQYPATMSKPSVFYKKNKKPKVRPWQYHREYRERRHIFEKFEGLGKYLGIKIKACIMRAICEVKNDLLPEGESFIQDVARIVFTIPLDHEFEDDYVYSAKDNSSNCARKFSVTCPFSPVEYFLQSGIRAPANWKDQRVS